MSDQLTKQDERAPISVSNSGVELRSFDEMARFCMAVSKSRLAPKGLETPEAIMVAVQCGLELGVGPMQALQGIAVINGRPSIFGDLALGLCQSKPDFEDIIETCDGTKATCTVKRKGRSQVTREFTEADAKKAQLWNKPGPWTLYPKRMLAMRARAYALRDSFADALKGISIREEVQDIKPPSREIKPVTGIVMPDEPEPVPALENAKPETETQEERNEDGSFKF
jgi:hypothetical protein